MANVLGELFGEIATAIRSKIGGTETMKPSEFPEKIYSIQAGGGVAPDGKYRVVKGSFRATAQQMTIEHDIGEVPDLFILNIDGAPSSGCLFFAVGHSQAMIDACGGGWLNLAMYVIDGRGAYGTTSEIGIDMPQEGIYLEYGGVRDFTPTQFTVGGVGSGLNVEYSYSWTAYCGMA